MHFMYAYAQQWYQFSWFSEITHLSKRKIFLRTTIFKHAEKKEKKGINEEHETAKR